MSNLKPVQSFEHLDQLIAKGVELYFGTQKLLAFCTRPDNGFSVYPLVGYVAENHIVLSTIRGLMYKPTLIRRPFKDGDDLKDVVEFRGIISPVEFVKIMEIDEKQVCFIYKFPGADQYHAIVLNKSQLIVEVEE